MEDFKPVEDIVKVLKDIINQNGLKYITTKPFEVYEKLLKSGASDQRTATALLSVFVSSLIPFTDEKLLSTFIQTECSFNEKMSDRLSSILRALYSKENRNEWRKRDGEGLTQFLNGEFICDWEGFAVWDEGNGTVNCHYYAHIILKPTDSIADDKDLIALLASNSFATTEEINELFNKRLIKYLDHDFKRYCTCEEYYQPTVEDYCGNLESNLKYWGELNGFDFISCNGSGYDDGYEPKHRIGGW